MKTKAGGVCIDCRQSHRSIVRGRCPKCLPAHDKARSARRRLYEPWLQFYSTKEWRAIRPTVFRRDGQRCRIEENGKRCAARRNLTVHHVRPLRLLWQDAAGDWRRFVRLASDPKRLVTVCQHHNRLLDAAHRKAEAGPGAADLPEGRLSFRAHPTATHRKAAGRSRPASRPRAAGGKAEPAGMVGRTYLLRGEPVVVLARWAGRTQRNVLVEYPDGRRVVRPFRGLRRQASQ